VFRRVHHLALSWFHASSLRCWSSVSSVWPPIQTSRRNHSRGSNAMRAFKSSSLPRSLRAKLSLGVIGIVLCSSLAALASARPRPVEDMGDPDPTEGTNPSPQGTSKAGGIGPLARVGTNHEIPAGTHLSWSQLRDFIFRLSRISWR